MSKGGFTSEAARNGRGKEKGEAEALGFYIIDNPLGKRGRAASSVKPYGG